MTEAYNITKGLGGRWYGNRGEARCPAHKDHNPSLSIGIGADGKTLVKCHAGCLQERVIAALRARGLWNDHREAVASYWANPGDETFGAAADATKATNGGQWANGEQALRIWERCHPAQGTLVETYLASRGITVPIPDVLRFHPKLWHREDGDEWPAMVARVDDRDGNLVAIHRTFLRPDGAGKAPISKARMMLGPCAGSAVRLSGLAVRLAVGEGIETCLSVLQATDLAVWSALSASGIRALELPDVVREVTLLVDADEAGEEAALFAGTKWKQAGLVVRIMRPTAGYNDFNEMLRVAS